MKNKFVLKGLELIGPDNKGTLRIEEIELELDGLTPAEYIELCKMIHEQVKHAFESASQQ